ncbi:MAG TPA: metal ABC transporter permease [Wenzhouxiangella sp.]|nr:metal ABC transporter permease [Wenzhouxiangella sp.]
MTEAAQDFGQPVVELLIAVLMMVVNLLPDAFSDPFQYGFMQRALLTAILVGAVCGLLSSYVILKRWSLLGDAISHAVLPGVAIAYLLGWPFFIGAFITGALTSLGIGLIERNSRIKSDAAMGLMFTAAFALGVVIISQITTSTHLMHILFGNVLGVRHPALVLTLFAGGLTLAVVALFYKQLLIYVFDPVQARSLGLNTTVIHYGLILLLTLTIVASLETVGIILVVSMLITPGATAYLLVNRLPAMMLLSTVIGVASSVIGLYLAYQFNVASGGAIVLVVTGFFLLAFLFAPQRGVLGRFVRHHRLRPA